MNNHGIFAGVVFAAPFPPLFIHQCKIGINLQKSIYYLVRQHSTNVLKLFAMVTHGRCLFNKENTPGPYAINILGAVL